MCSIYAVTATFPSFREYCAFYSHLDTCNRPYRVSAFLLTLKCTLCSDFIKGTHTEKKHQAIQLKPKLSLLPVSSLNGQTPFTAFERAILSASFVPNCSIWKHPWHISALLACLK